MDDRLVFFVKEFAALVEGQSLDVFRCDADPLRRSGMGGGSIQASVDQRGLEISKFLVTLIERAGAGDRTVKRQKILQNFGLVGHHSEKDRHASEILLHAFKNRLQIIGRFLFRQGLYHCHS
jgi:hypothetical protein